MSVRAVVFDFDGVLANSEPLHFRGFRDVLAGEGIALSEHDYYARYLGFDDQGAFEEVGRDRGAKWSADDVARMVERKAERLEVLERDGSVLFPGAAEAVARLAADYPLAIASGARREEIERILDRARLASFFPVIVAAGEAGAGKPAPEPYRRAVALLAGAIAAGRTPLAPSSCVAIEDSRWGLQSAHDAGLVTIGITHTYPATELVPADAIVANLDALTGEFLRSVWNRRLAAGNPAS